MKKSIFRLLALTLLVSQGCTKDKGPACDTSAAINKDSTSVIGTWELRAAYSGQGTTEPYADCNGNRIVFIDSHTYQRYTEWELTRSGTYRIFEDTIYMHHKKGNRLVFDNDTSFRTFIVNKGTTLDYSMDASDGPGATYVRRNED